jgi:hypothetical protein
LTEFQQMFGALLKGSQMGPGGGWFHPSQSRYGWEWLAARAGVPTDGKIDQKAFPGPAEAFQRLDRNRDGQLTADDFDWSDRSSFARQSMPATQWFRMADLNSNGRISQEEWLALFKRAARGKDYLTADDLREAFPTMPPARQVPAGRNPDMPPPLLLLQRFFTGELGSFQEGPAVGEKAPDFTLKTYDGRATVRLAGLVGTKPVVLVFGSFT